MPVELTRPEGPFAVFTGAGWGCAVGLPAASQLISTPVLVPKPAVRHRVEQVLAAFAAWSKANPELASEQFLTAVYERKVRAASDDGEQLAFSLGAEDRLGWGAAVELVALRIATSLRPDAADLPAEVIELDAGEASGLRYGERLYRASKFEKHLAFWERIGRGADFLGVVTTNYDLTVERSLRDRPERSACFYGGLGREQYAIGPTQQRGRRGPGTFRIKGELPLYKLHGSLNWHLRPSGEIDIYQDCRKAFAYKNTAAIVAPVEEKDRPEAFASVWVGAEAMLARAETWIVIGYSLPPYDGAIREMLANAARGGPRIVVSDPSDDAFQRWKQTFPNCDVLRGALL